MTRQLITNSYYGQPNTSNKISAGVIDVNITESINLKLKLNQYEINIITLYYNNLHYCNRVKSLRK